MIRYLTVYKWFMRHRFFLAAIVLLACWRMPALYASMDLQIESVRVQPARPVSSDAMTVYAIIKNSGSQPVSNFYVAVNLFQSGKLLKQIEDIPVLSELPRSGIGLSLPVEIGHFSEGEYKVEVFADSRNQIIESNEDNNSKTVSLRVNAASKGVNETWKSKSSY